MSTSPIHVTSLSTENSNTIIISFACHVPVDVHPPPMDGDFNDPLMINQPTKQHQLHTPSFPDVLLGNVGIVGTITFLGRSTAMIWIGWGKIQETNNQQSTVGDTARNIGAAQNLPMGPLMISMPRKKYRGAFASNIPSSKLISVSDLESDMMASQLSERISQRVNMAILVSCHFDDSCAPNTSVGLGTSSDIERHTLRRRAMTIAEQEICRIIKQHQSQT